MGLLISHESKVPILAKAQFRELSTTRTNGRNYSYLNATIGSTRIARRAGI